MAMQTQTMKLLELTIRYSVKSDGAGQSVMVGRSLTSPRDSAAALVPLLQDEPTEVFAILCLTTKHRVIAYHEVSRGTLDSTLVHPRLCSAQHNRGYVAEIVMWPWPTGAADHTGRHADRSHITDWLRQGCLRRCRPEGRLSWWAILFVLRSSIHRVRSARTECQPLDTLHASRRIRAIDRRSCNDKRRCR
jgi:hypothetical protein